MAHVNDITEELHKEIEAVPEEDRALLLRIVRSFREGVVTEPWFEEAVREGIRDADAGDLIDHAEVKNKMAGKTCGSNGLTWR
jgi:predicted transcriptional regulator